MGPVTHFLGIEFALNTDTTGNLHVSITQQSFVETLLDNLEITIESTSHFNTPYHSGHPIDSIPFMEMSSSDRDKLRLKYQSLVGSLNWLAQT